MRCPRLKLEYVCRPTEQVQAAACRYVGQNEGCDFCRAEMFMPKQ